MVAPCEPKQLTQSLVRVPNSGAEKPYEVTLLDLSRVSSAAATIPAMKLPPNLFPSKMHTQHRSIPSPDSGPLKPSKGTNAASASQPTVGHGLMHQQTTVGTASEPTIGATPTPLVEVGPRTSFQNGTSVSLPSDNGNVIPSTTTAALTPAGGRKRPFPVLHGEATHTATLAAPVGETKPAKVLKTTTASPRRTLPRSRATKEQILKENHQLRLENEALRRGCETFRNYYYQSMLNLQRLAFMGSLSAPQVH